MKRLHLAVIGLGRTGLAVADAVAADEALRLAGIVRRKSSLVEKLPVSLRHVPAVSHIGELSQIDAALICVPAEWVAGVAREVLQRGIPVVENAELFGAAFSRHLSDIDRAARRHGMPAIVGAGWDPGLLSLLRGFFSLLTPKGHTEISHRPGISLHHTLVARSVRGVREALATELRTADDRVQRYVYVELVPGVSLAQVEQAIRVDPLFLDEETLVFAVDSIADLEEEGHGVYVERQGVVNGDHQRFLFEGRFSLPVVAAQVMVAAARALPTCAKGAHTLFDLPPRDLWGEASVDEKAGWF